jgi:hypothetical protein
MHICIYVLVYSAYPSWRSSTSVFVKFENSYDFQFPMDVNFLRVAKDFVVLCVTVIYVL